MKTPQLAEQHAASITVPLPSPGETTGTWLTRLRRLVETSPVKHYQCSTACAFLDQLLRQGHSSNVQLTLENTGNVHLPVLAFDEGEPRTIAIMSLNGELQGQKSRFDAVGDRMLFFGCQPRPEYAARVRLRLEQILEGKN